MSPYTRAATTMPAIVKICHSRKICCPCSVSPRGIPNDDEHATPASASVPVSTISARRVTTNPIHGSRRTRPPPSA